MNKMELGLSLGDHQSAASSNPYSTIFLPKQQEQHSMNINSNGNIGILKKSDNKICGLGLGTMCMVGLGIGGINSSSSSSAKELQNNDAEMEDHTDEEEEDQDIDDEEVNGDDHRDVSSLHQLDLLPLLSSVPPLHNHHRMTTGKRFNVNSLLQLGGGGGGGGGCAATAAGEVTSVNSVKTSRFPIDFDLFKGGGCNPDDEDETNYINGANAKKKLRLSKEQSAYLEESFKEHHTLNPKQKVALAKQLNLRPRQIEVWFQNRRARTKLKQTEVDCEYLKRCCETLTEENKRLHKELQELRVLKSSKPFYMQVPATTLTMCSSCEKLTTSTTTPPRTATNNTMTTKGIPFPHSRSTRHYPFSQKTTNNSPHESSSTS